MSSLHQIATGVAACTGILMVFMAVISLGLGIQCLFNKGCKAAVDCVNNVKKWLV